MTNVAKRLSHLEKEPTMLRHSAGILALLILPGFLSAQETQTLQPRTHEVVKGETLWELAGRYLGNPFRWTLIAEANQGVVSNPDLIYPGQVLVIPTLGQDLARVEGVSVVSPGGIQVTLPEVQAQAPEGPTGVGTTGAPLCPGPNDRTVFYQGEGGERGCPMVLPPPDSRTAFYRGGMEQREGAAEPGPAPRGASPARTAPLPWVPLGLVYGSPWLESSETSPESVGTIDGFSGDDGGQASTDRAVLMEHLRIAPATGASFRVGDLLQSFRVSRTDEELGVVYSPTGILTVTSVSEAGVIAMVSAEYDRVRRGDLLRAAPAYTPRQEARPLPVQSNVMAEILGFAQDRPIHGLMARAFLSVGQREGISTGDAFVVFSDEAGDLSRSQSARLEVLLVGDTTSTARIVTVTDPAFKAGDRVLLVEKMQ